MSGISKSNGLVLVTKKQGIIKYRSCLEVIMLLHYW